MERQRTGGMTIRNHDIAELRRLDVAHHLPAQPNYKLQRAWAAAGSSPAPKGRHLFDGDGQRDPRRHGRAVVRQCRLRPQGTGRRRVRADARAALLQHLLQDRDAAAGVSWRPGWPGCSAASCSTSSSTTRARKPTTPYSASSAITGSLKGSPSARSSSAAAMPITARRSPARASAA